MEKQPVNQDQTIEESNAKETRVSKKINWSSYFKEFFMLFLAISLGFFVENKGKHMLKTKVPKSSRNLCWKSGTGQKSFT
jgi:Na+/glutamate symporter